MGLYPCPRGLLTGPWDGDDVMNLVYARPRTAEFMVHKLFRFFVHPRPSRADIDTLTDAWTVSNGDIRAVMEQIFLLPSFWGPEARTGLVKDPVEYAVGAVQRFQLPPRPLLRPLGNALRGMGQIPLNPPTVAGYPSGLGWAGASALFGRYNALYRLLYGRAAEGVVERMTEDLDTTTASGLVDGLLRRMGPVAATAETKRALLEYVDTLPNPAYAGRPRQVRGKSRGVLHLIGSSAEYQLA